MGKAILGILMIVTGLMGLCATVCGIVFLPMQGIGLIGIDGTRGNRAELGHTLQRAA